MLVSIVIRTLNEGRHLKELLSSIRTQRSENFKLETVIIDSGSTDDTLKIAHEFNCRITHISKDEFTFGKSLNLGSAYADGEILVYISGHCIPKQDDWIRELTAPIAEGIAHYTYGKQVGRDTTKFSEAQLFRKYFPEASKIPQEDFFVNNANAAISRKAWEQHKFDEELTGLEDMELGRRLLLNGGKIGYVATAPVFHIHDETWSQTKRRYEREALALQKIMPEVHVSPLDTLRYLFSAIGADCVKALKERRLMSEFVDILKFRSAQFIGTYSGNHDHRRLSQERKERYFYPNREI